MKKPVIGIVSLYDYKKKSLWMLPGYVEGLRLAGALPVIIPLETDPSAASQFFDICDGVLFTGGQDISPEIYGAKKSACCGEICPERDMLETALIKKCVEAGKPFLGICRGIQLINAVLGGTLYQDLPTEFSSNVNHRMKPPYNERAHDVQLVPGSPLQMLLGEEKIPVNSCHHQGVKQLAPSLLPMAYADDGLVEAAYLPSASFGWAVQWHPEMSYMSDCRSVKIFKSFVDSARKSK